MPLDEQQKRALEEQTDLLNWFGQQLVDLRNKFKPFMKLEKRQREGSCWQATTTWLRRHVLRQSGDT